MSFDLSICSIPELVALRAQIDAELPARRQAGIAAARQELAARAAELGVSLEELAAKPSKQSKPSAAKSANPVAPKYRDASGNTWTGRGKQPVWLREALALGASLDSFKIPG